MKKRPLLLLFCASLFAYFPIELLYLAVRGDDVRLIEIVLSGLLPILLIVGLVKVNELGWYTLVSFVALWGVRDLYDYYATSETAISSLLVHLSIYAASLGYFINPRIRHLYFDPKLRWWRTKPRFETHSPMIYMHGDKWHYPLLRNISDGGCFLQTNQLLKIGDMITLSIPLPEPLNLSVIKSHGQVRWVSDNPLQCGMGVQFTDATPKVKRAIREYVRRGW